MRKGHFIFTSCRLRLHLFSLQSPPLSLHQLSPENRTFSSVRNLIAIESIVPIILVGTERRSRQDRSGPNHNTIIKRMRISHKIITGTAIITDEILPDLELFLLNPQHLAMQITLIIIITPPIALLDLIAGLPPPAPPSAGPPGGRHDGSRRLHLLRRRRITLLRRYAPIIPH